MGKIAAEPIRKMVFPSGTTLEIVQGDITLMNTDVIVNAANEFLMHGAGVAGAILRRGGQIIQEESNRWVAAHGPINTNNPAVTSGGSLDCKYVIHAVGPVWGDGDEDKELARAIRSSFALASDLQATSISYPAISTGVFGFPLDRAADIFMKVFSSIIRDKEPSIRKILLVLFDKKSVDAFTGSFDAYFGKN